MAGTAYDVLGVSPSADPERLRTAYRELAMRFHPDRWVGADPQTRAETELRMKQINAAYTSIRSGRSHASSSRGGADRPDQTRPRPPRPDVQRARSASAWSYAPDAWSAGTARGHVCPACRTPYPPEEALCPRCFWPNRPNESPRRRQDRRQLLLVALVIVWVLLQLPGLISGLGPYLGLLFVPAAVVVWVGVQLRDYL